MIKVKAKEFDFVQLKDSGQAFRMMDDGVCIAMNKLCKVSGKIIECPDKDNEFWTNYFDLKTNYGHFIDAIDKKDKFLSQAADFGYGIRILRQDPWEMLITYIISQRRSIPSIKTCVERLCKSYGKKLSGGYYSFPSPKELSKATMDELLAAGLGYRAEYVYLATKAVASGEFRLEDLHNLNYEELVESLKSLRGVGDKVANCVALFGYHRIEAFPIDVWIARTVDQHYGGHFPLEKYEGFAGVMQQYMFYFARKA